MKLLLIAAVMALSVIVFSGSIVYAQGTTPSVTPTTVQTTTTTPSAPSTGFAN